MGFMRRIFGPAEEALRQAQAMQAAGVAVPGMAPPAPPYTTTRGVAQNLKFARAINEVVTVADAATRAWAASPPDPAYPHLGVTRWEAVFSFVLASVPSAARFELAVALDPVPSPPDPSARYHVPGFRNSAALREYDTAGAVVRTWSCHHGEGVVFAPGGGSGNLLPMRFDPEGHPPGPDSIYVTGAWATA